ncbi:TPA: C39 family peptidase [Streptococcus suis]|nr:C39 family peptidase [Streptococcus suis]HEM5147789.1 C39 family peptidase [Streptococcus suis]HEM5148982.1 C39 family peptidase [Streptococcus suis]HEM5204493.1 C39 family peptidase [Streptococcus suis]HEM5214986.1 C39 family peptidase [Streptococcus suis]
MKKKIIWSVASLLTILLGCIIFLFPLHNGSSTQKDNVTDEVVNGSKKNIGTSKSDDESDTVGKNPPIKQEIIDRQEDKQAGIEEKNSNQPQQLQEENSINLVEVDFTKPNPPITQETIDRLEREQAGVGKKVMLNVTPQVQRAWNTCAPTTVSMMLSSRGISVSQEVLAQEMKTDTIFGTHNANAIQVLNRHLFGYDMPQVNQAGYRLETVTTSDVNSEQMRLFKERLKKNIKDGYPMYYTFDCATIYPGSYGEHNVIGVGYQLSEDGSDIAYLYYLDPSYTKQDPVYGGLKKVTPKELFEGMLTCVEPNYAW